MKGKSHDVCMAEVRLLSYGARTEERINSGFSGQREETYAHKLMHRPVLGAIYITSRFARRESWHVVFCSRGRNQGNASNE